MLRTLRRPSVRWAAVVGAIAVALSACTAPSQPAAAPAPGTPSATTASTQPTAMNYSLEFRIDGIHAPYLVAQDKGWYADAGLDVTFAPSNGSQDSLNRVATGSADIGSVTSLVALQGVEKNLPVTVVGVVLQHDPSATQVLVNSGIEHPKDLAGKTLGSTPSGLQKQLFKAFAAKVGLDASTVTDVAVDPATVKPALLGKQIDGSNFFEPLFSGMTEVKNFPWYEYGIDLVGTVVIANNDYLAKNPDAVRAFLSASAKGMDATLADPAAAGDVVAKVAGTAPDFYRKQVPDFVKYFDVAAAPSGTFSVSDERWTETIAIYRDNGLLQEDLDPTTFFDPAYLPKAAA